MFFPTTGNEAFDKATDEVLALFSAGRDADACRLLVSALADAPVSPEMEPRKRELIKEMRALLNGEGAE